MIGVRAFLTIYGRKDRLAWNEYVKSFIEWDVYYLYEYAYSCAIHGNGEMLLISFENSACRLCYAVMQRDLANSNEFREVLPEGIYFDW